MAKADENLRTSDECKYVRVSLDIHRSCVVGSEIKVDIYDGINKIAWLTHTVSRADVAKEKNSYKSDEYQNPFLSFTVGDMKTRDLVYRHDARNSGYDLMVEAL